MLGARFAFPACVTIVRDNRQPVAAKACSLLTVAGAVEALTSFPIVPYRDPCCSREYTQNNFLDQRRYDPVRSLSKFLTREDKDL